MKKINKQLDNKQRAEVNVLIKKLNKNKWTKDNAKLISYLKENKIYLEKLKPILKILLAIKSFKARQELSEYLAEVGFIDKAKEILTASAKTFKKLNDAEYYKSLSRITMDDYEKIDIMRKAIIADLDVEFILEFADNLMEINDVDCLILIDFIMYILSSNKDSNTEILKELYKIKTRINNKLIPF